MYEARMGNLRACFAVAMLALAACGEDHAKTDASIVLIDSPSPDAKVFNDAPAPVYDLSCLNGTPPTTAADPITLSGTTQTFGSGGGSPLENVVVDVFKNGNNTSLATDTSDSTGAFATGNIATGGTPIDGYVRAVTPVPQNGMPTHRTTYMYPPSVVTTSLTDVPVIIISNATFDMFGPIATQDDTVNGAILFVVTDCNNTDQTLIAEANATVEQNGTQAGTVFGLGAFIPQLAGTFIALNVPDGEAQIKASYNSMNFPTRTVRAFKKPAGQDQAGTLTFTAVRPGP